MNESDADITTEVAFPIPAYAFSESAGGTRDFDDFKAWVDGKELRYAVEAKAFSGRYDETGKMVDPKDVTAILDRYGVDIPSFGHYKNGKYEKVLDFERLAPAARKVLVDAGLVDADDDRSTPTWEVRKKYHWTQMFPAHRMLHIRHEYTPASGFELMQVEVFDKSSREKLIAEEKATGSYATTKESVGQLTAACVEPSLEKALFAAGSAAHKADVNDGYISAMWVDYILTTANSWKMPIKDFTLVMDKGPQQPDIETSVVSLCWDGALRMVDTQHYESVLKDFVPRKELHILFLNVPKAEAVGATPKAGAGVVAVPVPVAASPSWRWWVSAMAVLLVLVGVLGWMRVRRG